jgi:hypothetical protein
MLRLIEMQISHAEIKILVASDIGIEEISSIMDSIASNYNYAIKELSAEIVRRNI